MKKYYYFIFLLIFLFTSCSNSYNYYENKQYEQAVLFVNSKKNLNQKDFITKGLSLYKLNKTNEAKKSLLIAQLMSNKENINEESSEIVVGYDFSPELNILALKNSSSVISLISLYKSYSKINDKENALYILKNQLINLLSIEDFATLITNYPADEDYNLSILVSWYETLQTNERDSFISSLKTFTRLQLNNPQTVSTALRISQGLLSNENDNLQLASIYEIIGNCCINLNDRTNAKKYWVASLKLNPDNKYLEGQLVKYD